MTGNPKRSGPEMFEYHVHVGVTSTYLRETSAMRDDPIRSKPTYWSDHDWLVLVDNRRLGITDDTNDHADLLIHDLDRHAIPRIHASLTDEGLRVAVDSSVVGVGGGWARLLMEIEQGNVETAASRLADAAIRLGDNDHMVVRLRQRLADVSRPGRSSDLPG